jgi:hypothetical protein
MSLTTETAAARQYGGKIRRTVTSPGSSPSAAYTTNRGSKPRGRGPWLLGGLLLLDIGFWGGGIFCIVWGVKQAKEVKTEDKKKKSDDQGLLIIIGCVLILFGIAGLMLFMQFSRFPRSVKKFLKRHRRAP